MQVEVSAVETFADLLFAVDSDDAAGSFYNRLCEAACRSPRWTASVGLPLRLTRCGACASSAATASTSTRSATSTSRSTRRRWRCGRSARTACSRRPSGFAELLPPEYERFLDRHAPGVHADLGRRALAGRDPRPTAPSTGRSTDGERHLLWTLGKIAALAASARVATREQERARQLQERIDLAREIHDGVIQRLFGVSLALSGEELSDEAAPPLRRRDPGGAGRPAHARCSARSAARRARPRTTLRRRGRGARRRAPGARRRARPSTTAPTVPAHLEPLAQSVLAEALRNALKHADPTASTSASTAQRRVRARGRQRRRPGDRGAARGRAWACGSPRSRRSSTAASSSSAAPTPAQWRVRLLVPGRGRARERQRRALRVLVVDDHDVVHWGFRLMLTEQPWVERCLSARNGDEALALAAALRAARRARRPVHRRGVRRRGLRARCATRVARARACCSSPAPGGSRPSAARAAGASGFVPKEWPAREIAEAVRMVGRGMTVFERDRGAAGQPAVRARARGARPHRVGRDEPRDRRARCTSRRGRSRSTRATRLPQARRAQPRPRRSSARSGSACSV